MTNLEILETYAKVAAIVGTEHPCAPLCCNLYTLNLALQTRKKYRRRLRYARAADYMRIMDARLGEYYRQLGLSEYSFQQQLGQAYDLFADLSPDEMLAFWNIVLNIDACHPEQGVDLEIPIRLTWTLEERLEGRYHVLVPFAPYHGPALKKLIKLHPEVQFTLAYRGNEHAVRGTPWYMPEELPASMYADCPNARVIVTDFYAPYHGRCRYDLIFACPYLNQQLNEVYPGYSQLSDLRALQTLLPCLGPGGELIMVMPASQATAAGERAELRKRISQYHGIREICALPYSVHCVDQVAISLFILSPEPPRYFVMSSSLPAEKPLLSGRITPPWRRIEQLLAYEKFCSLPEWSRSTLLSHCDELMAPLAQSGCAMAPLRKYARVFNGSKFSGPATPQPQCSAYRLIDRSALSRGCLPPAGLPTVAVPPGRAKRYILQEGDVLLASDGPDICVELFAEQPLPCLPADDVLVIRPRAKLRGAYLRVFLRGAAGRCMLASIPRDPAHGLCMSSRDLGSLEVPVPSVAYQDQLLAEYVSAHTAYEEGSRALQQHWQTCLADLQQRWFAEKLH